MKNKVSASGFVCCLFAFFVLSVTPCLALVTGTVTDTAGSPVSGALVTFTDESNSENEYSAYTDEEGKYSISFTPVNVKEETPANFQLYQNYPNPFNPSTTIPFSLNEAGFVNLSIYNITGQKIRSLVDNYYSIGSHKVTWNGLDDSGKSVATGIYIYQLKFGDNVESRKMLLIDGGGIGSLSKSNQIVARANVIAKSVSDAENTTYLVTITGDDIESYEESGVNIVDGETYDFVVVRKTSEIHGITFVTIPAGTFQMGDIQGVGYSTEKPVHVVTISTFEMSIYEVTNAQYASFLTEALVSNDITASSSTVKGASGVWSGQEYLDVDSDYCNISYSNGKFSAKPGKEEHPAQQVSWYGSKAFAEYYGLDLPTEAEWEYACRAGTETMFYTGNDLSSDGVTSTDLDKAGWYLDNSDTGGEYPWTHPVGQKEPNVWGLYDMQGNVWEWCNDWYGESYYSSSPSSNPNGPLYGSYRVVRGGNWRLAARGCRSAARSGSGPAYTFLLGFRVVRRPDGTTPDTHTIIGRVLLNDSGFMGVTVTMDGETTTTGSDGIYAFRGLSDVTYTITFAKSGYTFSPSSKEVTVSGSDVTADDVTATESRGGDIPTDLIFVTIPGGTFQMGDVENAGYSNEKPVHTVTLSSFDMSTTEITNVQYAVYLNEALASGNIEIKSGDVYGMTGDWPGERYLDIGYEYDSNNKCWILYSNGTFSVTSGYETWPVVAVTWYGSKAFALYYGLDLPTEAEWEYACRGGKQFMYGTNDGTINSSKANYNGNVGHTSNVGNYPANPFGLYDMSGNVWEWCNDWFGTYWSGRVTNPSGALTGSELVFRGGGWGSDTDECRSAKRGSFKPDLSHYRVGFRVVRRKPAPPEITFVPIPGGAFQMGDVENAGFSNEKPVHTVTLSSFDMSTTEITNAQYTVYLNEALASGNIEIKSGDVYGMTGDWPGERYLDIGYEYDSNNKCWILYSNGTFTVTSGKENWPVVFVSWYGSKAFALYYGLDLPTEAEWEYTCRGGKQFMYGTDDGTINSSKANYNGNVGYTTNVGSYPPNPFGMYDMSGNVWEWCHDWYVTWFGTDFGDVTNPSGALTGSGRVIRSGGWGSEAVICRSACRGYDKPDFSHYRVGFRVVRRSPPQN